MPEKEVIVMKRILALIFSTVMLLTLMTGCGEKNEVKDLLKDYQKSCRSLDMEDMAECFNPSIIKPLTGLFGLLGIELDDVSNTLTEVVSFASEYSGENLEEIYQSISISPKSFSFGKEKDECDVSAEIEFTVDGEKKTEQTTFHCKKVDGDWYIFSIK